MSSGDSLGAGKRFGEEDGHDVPFSMKRGGRETIEAQDRLRALEDGAESLAGRLAAAGRTATPTQLLELMDRYREALNALEEADSAWLATQRALLASSV